MNQSVTDQLKDMATKCEAIMDSDLATNNKAIKQKVNEQSMLLTDIYQLQAKANQAYELKGKLISMRRDATDAYDLIRRYVNAGNYALILYYKTGQANFITEKYGVNSDVYPKPSNDAERKSLRDLVFNVELQFADRLNSKITELGDHIESVRNIIYSIESFVSIHKIKNGL